MAATPDEARAIYAAAERLYDADAVEAALDRMAQAITADLRERNPVLVCVMTGGLVPAGCLITRLDFPLQLDYVHVTRYRGDVRGGELHWSVRPSTPLAGRAVLVIDDIIDEGHTFAAVLADCRAQGAESVYGATLVDKRHDRKAAGAHAEFVGLEVPDRYVFGYGMDYRSYLRNAPGIYAVSGL